MTVKEPRKKILLFADWYEPGFKAGGPIRSCVNFVHYMRGDYRVDVFTSDRDLNAAAPYEGIRADTWNEGPQESRIYYSSPAMSGWRNIRRQLRESAPDFIYLNSMFSPRFTILPLMIAGGLGLRGRVVLSPRGMLRASALQFKPLKKKLFLRFLRWSGLSRGIHFHATDQTELQDVQRHFGASAKVSLIPNFPAALPASFSTLSKTRGEAALIFVGRVHPIKNLDFLLKTLREVRATIRLTIVGSIEDSGFWQQCKELIGGLPAHIVVTHAGELPHHELPALLALHHLFVLPTQGENFGHAIQEALATGRPVLISDQTPWRNLQATCAGWDLSLNEPGAFRQAIEELAGLDQQGFDLRCQAAYRFVQQFTAGLTLHKDYLQLFSEIPARR